MKHWRAVLPATIHEVDYEETVGDLEGVARRLLQACGLEWEPACLDFHRTDRPVRTASVTQVRQPVYRSSVGRWKHYETELADLFAALPEIGPSSSTETFVAVKGAWGRRGGTNVRLETADEASLRHAIVSAWRNVAPKRLARDFEPEQG